MVVVNPSLLPIALRNNWDQFEVSRNDIIFSMFPMLLLDAGRYYLCTDSGEIVRELPLCMHQVIDLAELSLMWCLPDEVWNEFLAQPHHETFRKAALQSPQCYHSRNILPTLRFDS